MNFSEKEGRRRGKEAQRKGLFVQKVDLIVDLELTLRHYFNLVCIFCAVHAREVQFCRVGFPRVGGSEYKTCALRLTKIKFLAFTVTYTVILFLDIAD